MLETTNIPTRRRWLETATLATLGSAFAAKSLSQTRLSREPTTATVLTPPTPTPSVDPEPTLATTPPAPAVPARLTYEQFFDRFHFRHIQPHEVINPHQQRTRGVANSLPPIELWSAIPATLFVADEIRARLGKPLKLITSAYRNPRYNKACGGARGSWHTKNCALDLVYEGGPGAAYQIARDLRREGLFEGGIGLYQTFIHLDTRGRNTTWHG